MGNTDGRLLKGVLTLLFGSLSARLIGLASMPILTRIYSPEDYGVLAIFAAFTTMSATVCGLRFSQAVPLPKKDVLAFNVIVLGFISIILFSISLFLILSFLADSIFNLFNAQELKRWWWLIVIASLSIAVFELFTMWAVRLKNYQLISTTQIRQSFLGEATKFVIGLIGLKPFGLMLGHFIGQSFGVGAYLKGSSAFFEREIKRVTLKRLLFLAKYYAPFVYYRLPSDLLLNLSVQAPVIMATKLYNSSVTGQISLTFMAMGLPVSLIGAAVSRVYYAEISSIGRHDNSRIRIITIQIQKKLFLLALPVAILVYLFAEKMFGFVFGGQWSTAGLFASMLAPYLLMQFASSPLMQLINVIGKQKIFLILNGGRVIGLAILYFLASTQQFIPETFIAYLSIFLFLYYSVQFIVIFSLLRK